MFWSTHYYSIPDNSLNQVIEQHSVYTVLLFMVSFRQQFDEMSCYLKFLQMKQFCMHFWHTRQPK